jgi:hypothetical protein
MPIIPARYKDDVNTASQETGLPVSVVAAQINLESGWNPKAVSPAGAEGIAQFMPGTWASLGIPGTPFDPDAAFQGYAKYMSRLLKDEHNNVRNALAAYNAGEGNIQAGMGYADTILKQAGQPATLTGFPGEGIIKGVTGSIGSFFGDMEGLINPLNWIKEAFGLGNITTDFQDWMQRLGLILLGGIVLILGLLVLAKPAEQAAIKGIAEEKNTHKQQKRAVEDASSSD